jgi:hypothetical protein
MTRADEDAKAVLSGRFLTRRSGVESLPTLSVAALTRPIEYLPRSLTRHFEV